MKRQLTAFGVCLVLAACGFQLRGQLGLPETMARTHVAAPQPNGELARELKRLLRANGVEVVDHSTPEAAVLEITDERLDRQVQSVGARARVREFALHYDVGFRVVSAEGEVVVPIRHVELTRDYTFDAQQVLGTASEEEILRRDLRRAMANRILTSLSAN